MEFATVTVRGPDVAELLTEMTGPLSGMNKTRYAAEGISVLAWECYDVWRTNSDLMAVVVMDRTGARTCEVGIMVGGGGDDLLGLDWSVSSAVASQLLDVERSAEAAAFEEAIESLEEACDALDLEIDAD